MKWRILFICFLPIWHTPIIAAKSQEVLTGYRPLQSGDKISTVEMYVLCRKLFEKVNNPGHGKGIVSGAKSPQDLCDTLFERLFFTTKRISTISGMYIPALDALQEIAVKDSDSDKINHGPEQYIDETEAAEDRPEKYIDNTPGQYIDETEAAEDKSNSGPTSADRDSSDEEYKKTTHYSTWSVGPAQYIDETEAAKDNRESSDEEYKKTTHYSTWSVGPAQYIDETEAAKDNRESSDEEYKKTTHYSTWSVGPAQYINETEAAEDNHGSNEIIEKTTPQWIEETTTTPKSTTKKKGKWWKWPWQWGWRWPWNWRYKTALVGFDNPIYGEPDVDDVDGEPIRCRYTLLTKHDDDDEHDLDKTVLKKKKKENDRIKKDKKRVVSRLKFKPVSARKSNLRRNKNLQRDKMESVDEQVEKVLKVVALLHNTNQNADDEIDRVETLTEYFQKLITMDDLNESTTPKMQPVIHDLGDDDAKDSGGENTEREKTALKVPPEFLLSDENM